MCPWYDVIGTTFTTVVFYPPQTHNPSLFMIKKHPRDPN